MAERLKYFKVQSQHSLSQKQHMISNRKHGNREIANINDLKERLKDAIKYLQKY